jgi:hypothetical protein
MLRQNHEILVTGNLSSKPARRGKRFQIPHAEQARFARPGHPSKPGFQANWGGPRSRGGWAYATQSGSEPWLPVTQWRDC